VSELEQQCTKAQLIALVSVAAVIMSFTAPAKKQPANVNKQQTPRGSCEGAITKYKYTKSHL